MSYVGRGRARNVINLAARYLRLSPPRTPEKPGGKKVVAIPIPGSLVPEPIHDTVVSEFVPPTFIPNKYDTVVDIDLQRSLEVGARARKYIPKPYNPNLGNRLPAPGSDTGKPQIGLTNLTGTEVIVNDHT